MSTYSTTLRLELIGNGQQDGTWGDTTNLNLGSLLESAITGVQDITFTDANYTMTAYNGLPDESRNAVLVLGGTNTAVRQLIAPSVEKVYIVKNSTTGGYGVTIKTSGGTGLTIPNGSTQIVYCNGTEFYLASGLVAGTGITVSGATVSLANTSVAAGSYTASNITVDAQGRLTAATSTSLGTMSAQNATSVAITGGTIANATITGGSITGITDLAVADGGTGSSTLAANNVLLGNGTSALQTVAPSTAGNVLKSNGTTWVSGAGFGWNVTYASVSKSAGDSYTLPSNCIGVYVWCQVYGGGNNGGIGKIDIKNSGGTVLGTANINGTNIGGGADGGSGMTDGAGSFIPVSSTATELYFYTASNNVGGSFIIQAYVTSA